MINVLDRLSKVAIVLALVVFAVSVATSTGAFTTVDLSRPSGIQFGDQTEAMVGLDVTDTVSVACGERLVTVTNNFDQRAQFEVSILEERDGDLTLSESTPAQESVSFALSPGQSETVYVTNTRGPITDDVEFDVTATTSDTEVTISKRVPKVPGNEDEGDDDGNWGGDGCENGDDEDNGNGNGGRRSE